MLELFNTSLESIFAYSRGVTRPCLYSSKAIQFPMSNIFECLEGSRFGAISLAPLFFKGTVTKHLLRLLHHQHRTGGLADDPLGDASHEQPL